MRLGNSCIVPPSTKIVIALLCSPLLYKYGCYHASPTSSEFAKRAMTWLDFDSKSNSLLVVRRNDGQYRRPIATKPMYVTINQPCIAELLQIHLFDIIT